MRSMPIAVLLAAGVLAARADSAPPADRYSHMHMKFEKTFLGIDVANVDVTFDAATSEQFAAVAAGQEYSDQLAERMARTALGAQSATVEVQFLRDVSLGDFLSAAHKNLNRAHDASYISDSTLEMAWDDTRRAFAVPAAHGFDKGDKIIYRVTPDSLQTTLMSGDRVVFDVTSPGAEPRRALLASYFAPKTDFRTKLIKTALR